MFEGELAAWQERIDAARRANERFGPLAAEKAKKCEHLTLETLPVPKDERVRFIPLPARQVAAVRFSGYFNPEKIERNKEQLGLWVEELGLETEGDFIVAGYNPPWVPGFLARNEVMIDVKTQGSGG